MFINKTRNIIDLNSFNEDAKELNSKIQIVLKFGNDDLRFTLSEALTTEEDAALDNLVNNFVDTDLALKVPKIYDLSNESGKHFHAINYKLGLKQSLIPVRSVVKGEVQKVIWYKSLDAEMKPSEPILKVDITYSRDGSGFALFRTSKRTWYNIDGSENEETKNTEKYYFVNESDMIDEGIKRRTLLIKGLQIPVMKGMMASLVPKGYSETSALLLGRHFMDDYRTSFEDFKQNSSTITNPSDANYGKKTIVAKLENEDNPDYVVFLDEAPVVLNTPFNGTITLRNYMIEEFSI